MGELLLYVARAIFQTKVRYVLVCSNITPNCTGIYKYRIKHKYEFGTDCKQIVMQAVSRKMVPTNVSARRDSTEMDRTATVTFPKFPNRM